MPTRLQLRRGNTSVSNALTGAAGELFVDTEAKALVLHDGVAAGGYRLLTTGSSGVDGLQNTNITIATTLAQAAFDKANTGTSSYSNTNVASYLSTYNGTINAKSIVNSTDYVNIGSNIGFQLQYDPTGVYNVYDIATGSWVYFDASGFVWQSNTTGTTHTLTLNNNGSLTFDDSTIQTTAFTGYATDNTARITANAAFDKANTTPSELANGSFTLSLVSDGQLIIPQSTQGAVTAGYLTSLGNIGFNANGNLWKFGADGTMDSPYNVHITTTGFKWPDNSTQNTAFTGYATDNTARTTANSASSYANSAYAAANSAASVIAQNAQSTSYTLQLTDAGKHILSTNSSTQVITVPNNGNVSWNVGSTVMLVIQGSGTMNVVPQTGITMYMANNSTAKSYANLASYGMATLLNVGANTWFINGAGVS